MSAITVDRKLLQRALKCAEDTGYPLALIADLRAALAQQAEPVEPVAWMFELARNFNLEGYGGWEKRITEYRPNTPEGSVRNVTPLYTAPSQRKPLTLEEIHHATGHCGVSKYTAVNITRAVERAHGIKEN